MQEKNQNPETHEELVLIWTKKIIGSGK
jgi:hypothetical protein